MGQSIVVNEKPSPNRGVVRFETNRAITGMGHERYLAGTEVWGNRPPDELARRLLAHGGVLGVQINGNVVTVDLARGHTADGLKAVIENLYRFYPDGAAAPAATPTADDAVAAESAPTVEPADETAPAADIAPSSADPEAETQAQAPLPATAPADPTAAAAGPAEAAPADPAAEPAADPA
ncbi:MAG: hypothetical protein JWM47_2125 [Acidimicrobiales bacterium]|nr:hypothetical protein [Acidimicrobiales bacterium]